MLALADRVRRWHEAQRPPDVALEVEPGVVLERRWVPLQTVGVYVPRNLVSTLVMCAVPAQAAGVERIVVCTPPAGAGLVAAAAELLGIDEVWALGGPQAIGWLAYVRRVDKIVGPGNAVRERREARGLARRRRSTCPAGRPRWSSSPTASADPRIVELELAAQREHGHDAVCRVVATLEEAEELAPEHLVLLGESEARAERGAQRRRRLRRPDRRRSPPGDYATGGNHVLPTGGWARSVGGLGLETFLKPITIQRITPEGPRAAPPDGRGARRRRGHARARGGGAAMKPLAPEFKAYTWATPTDEVARLAGIDPSQVVRYDQNTPPLPLPSTRPGAIAGALAGINGYPPGGYVDAAPRDRRLHRRRPRPDRARRRRRRPDPALRARASPGPGDAIAIPARADVSALPDRRAARGRRGRRRRPGAHLRLPAEQPARRAVEPLPDARPLVVDEAYFEYFGETAIPLSTTAT